MAYRQKMSRTLEKLEASIVKLKESLSGEFESKFERGILVEITTKRFEYNFENLWKVLKEILLNEGVECTTPLACFKESFSAGLVDKKFEEVFPLMVKKRNEIVHIYSDDEAFEIYLHIKNTFAEAIFDTFQKIQKRLAGEK